MGRRTDIVSIGLSLSLALALFVHLLPTERSSAPKSETVPPPTPLLKAVRISVATLDLPPPPLTALPSPAQSTVKAAVVRPLKPAGPAVAKTTVSPLKPSIDPPVSPLQKVAKLKPTPKTQSLQNQQGQTLETDRYPTSRTGRCGNRRRQ